MKNAVTEKSRKITFKLFSLNCWFNGPNRDQRCVNIVEMIANTNPDVICLQELVSETFQYFYDTFSNNFNETYSCSIPCWPRNKYYGNATWVKKDFCGAPEYEIITMTSEQNRSVPCVTIKIGNEKLLFANVHLESNAPAMAKKQLKFIADLLKDETSVIICGDFNFSEGAKLHSYILHEKEKSFDRLYIRSNSFIVDKSETLVSIPVNLMSDHPLLIAEISILT